MKKFALIGAAGFIAPRHMKAIGDTGHELVAAVDKFDSVGVLDQYFPKADFFTEFERFERHLEKLRREQNKIDFISICSPNYLHDTHIRFGLRSNATVICEKPLVLNPWNIDALLDVEKETGNKVYTVLQLRHHPSIISLKDEIEKGPADKVYEVDLHYITPRGNWYQRSWKGDIHKSGGVATNIGIHFFDMLIWLFGSVIENNVTFHTAHNASGNLVLQKAKVNWFLSINEEDIPLNDRLLGKKSHRSLMIDQRIIEFSEGFTDLHTIAYKSILEGKGFGIEDARQSIQLVHDIRNKK